jgi:hypothetical protein
MADSVDSGGTNADLDGFPGISDKTTRDDPMPDAEDLLETPQQLLALEDELLSSADLTHRYGTRARTRQEKAHEEIVGARATPLFSKLQAASGRPSTRASSSKLEDSRDIQNLREDVDEGDENDKNDENDEQDENDEADAVKQEATKNARELRAQHTSRPRSNKGQFTSRRQSARIKARHGSQPTGVTPRKRASRAAITEPGTKWWPRRSARLAKPLTEFQKFPELPPELQMMIWERVPAPRLVYVRNRSAPNPTYTVQSSRPSWFMACSASCEVAEKSYQKMFALWRPDHRGPVQPVNPDIDIIALEPCGSGCRAHYCTRHQFSDEDRAAVRFLAVQTESEYLLQTARACWETISQSWPNVETLYLMRRPIIGNNSNEHILYRIKEGVREMYLRGAFDTWKKGAGKDKPMETLEFVAAESKQQVMLLGEGTLQAGLHNSKTGRPEDIIVG